MEESAPPSTLDAAMKLFLDSCLSLARSVAFSVWGFECCVAESPDSVSSSEHL